MLVHSRVFLSLYSFIIAGLVLPGLKAQSGNFTRINAEIHFEEQLRSWDGFGFNYVEEAQYRDISSKRQDYGGFSYLDDESKNEIIELVFGEEGLKPGLVKMFLDPFHQAEPDGPFNHTLTTSNMLDFVSRGYQLSLINNRSMEIITTLYGPPAFVTKQKVLRGRDFDPTRKQELAAYLTDWAKFLVEDRELPLKYISLHNEGDDWQRWHIDGGDSEDHYNHDYNMFWPPDLVVDFLKFLPGRLAEEGLEDIALTPGECYGWDRFVDYGYARALCNDKEALDNLGLVTSHGFISCGWKKWNPQHTSRGIDIIREQKPGMHSWVTSTSWGSMDSEFVRQIYSNIYTSKVNAIIPWAGIQRPGLWVGGDPNAGSAIHVFEDGSFKIRKGYYFYKQVSRAGQPGMAVANSLSMDAEVKYIAFSGAGTDHPDAFIVINMGDVTKELSIEISGTKAKKFTAYRSKDDESELYQSLGSFTPEGKTLLYEAPARSVTTFYAE